MKEYKVHQKLHQKKYSARKRWHNFLEGEEYLMWKHPMQTLYWSIVTNGMANNDNYEYKMHTNTAEVNRVIQGGDKCLINWWTIIKSACARKRNEQHIYGYHDTSHTNEMVSACEFWCSISDTYFKPIQVYWFKKKKKKVKQNSESQLKSLFQHGYNQF